MGRNLRPVLALTIPDRRLPHPPAAVTMLPQPGLVTPGDVPVLVADRVPLRHADLPRRLHPVLVLLQGVDVEERLATDVDPLALQIPLPQQRLQPAQLLLDIGSRQERVVRRLREDELRV